ncbi:hypothetical protein [Wolbachia endosymbiont (group B) of Idaea biselata]|uniref:hypothetical protein n=1 Tax=Wolbachia endosymbiont (group B) of Idaea biselata TaxID=3066179 RepID=UPI003132AF03
MSRYEDLTEEQKKLYNTLRDEIKNKKNITSFLKECTKKGVLKKILTTANITEKLKNGTEYNITPLAYAINFDNFKETIKVILEASEDKKEVLNTANITEKLKDGTEYNLTPLGYAISFDNFKETIKVILEASEDKKEVLNTANITEKLKDGTEYNLTPLGYAISFDNFKETIKVILEASEDKKEVLNTANITEKLKDGTEYNLTPLGYAMNFIDFEEIIKVLLEASEDKKEVLTTANITKKLKDGTEYNLTPLGYAMNFINCEKKIKVILEASEDNNMLEEVFARVEGNDRKKLQEILKALKSQEQDEGQETKIDNWLAILADSISSCKSNEKPLVPESRVPKTEENIVKTTNKSIMIGSVCGVIAALTVGGGCFAAGIALPILALIGIAVAAAVFTGLVAGGITYEVYKPCDELKEAIAAKTTSSPSEVDKW